MENRGGSEVEIVRMEERTTYRQDDAAEKEVLLESEAELNWETFKMLLNKSIQVGLKGYAIGFAVEAGPAVLRLNIVLAKLSITYLQKIARGRDAADVLTKLVATRQMLGKSLVRGFGARFAIFAGSIFGLFKLLEKLCFFAVLRAVPSTYLEQIRFEVYQDVRQSASFLQLARLIDVQEAHQPRAISKKLFLRIKCAAHDLLRRQWFPAAVAGVTSSLLTLRILPVDRRADLMLFILVRSIDIHIKNYAERCRMLNRTPFWRHLHLPMSVENNMDAVVFIISCTEIMYSWFYTPESLPR